MLTDLSIVPPDGEPQLKSRRRIAKADEANLLTSLSPLFLTGRPRVPTRTDRRAISSMVQEKAPKCIGHLGDSMGSHLAILLGNHVARPSQPSGGDGEQAVWPLCARADSHTVRGESKSLYPTYSLVVGCPYA